MSDQDTMEPESEGFQHRKRNRAASQEFDVVESAAQQDFTRILMDQVAALEKWATAQSKRKEVSTETRNRIMGISTNIRASFKVLRELEYLRGRSDGRQEILISLRASLKEAILPLLL